MKKCKFQKRARLYAEGELSPSEARNIRHHLLECAACMSLVKDTRTMAETFEQIGRIRPTPALRDRILCEMSGGESAARVNPGAVVSMCRKIGAAAACMFFLFGGLVALNLKEIEIKNVVATSENGSAIAKNSPDYYPFSLLEESDRTFLSGDISSAFENLYALPE